MTDYNLILSSKLSQAGETLTPKARSAVNQAIVECCIVAVQKNRDSEAKAINKEAVKFIPSILKGELTAWIRYQYLKRAKKTAQLLADSRNMLHYVIRKSVITYTIIPNDMVDHYKKTGVFPKDATAKKLTELSDFVAYPKREIKLKEKVYPVGFVAKTKDEALDYAKRHGFYASDRGKLIVLISRPEDFKSWEFMNIHVKDIESLSAEMKTACGIALRKQIHVTR